MNATARPKPIPRMPVHDLTGKRIPPATVVQARELEIGEEIRRLTFELSKGRRSAAQGARR